MHYTWHFARKTWFNKKIFLPAPCYYTTSKEFIDARVSHSRSLKFFYFETVSIFQNCYRTCKSVDEKISEIKNTNKTLKTSHKKCWTWYIKTDIPSSSINWDFQLINQVYQMKFWYTWFHYYSMFKFRYT